MNKYQLGLDISSAHIALLSSACYLLSTIMRNWAFFLTILVIFWPGAHSQINSTFDVNITYENLGHLFVENTMCHVRMDFNLKEFLLTISENEEHLVELDKSLLKVILNAFSFCFLIVTNS